VFAVAAAIAPAGVLAQQDDKPAAKQPPAQPPAKPAVPAGPPALDARAWILVDPRDGEVLAAKAPDRPAPIASATKLMTAYLALKKLNPKKTLRAAPYPASAAESLLGLRAGERMLVSDLLYALMLPSANDAAVTLAEGVAGTVPRFVEQMNRQADALGLENTSFSTPVGLDTPDNYSTPADLVELAAENLEIPLFARIVDTPSVTLKSGDRPRRITTRNTLLLSDPSLDGVKTGHTSGAGYVLVGSATRDGTQLISAVLGTRSEAARDAETEELLAYGFSLYKPSSPVKAGEELAAPELDWRDEELPLVAERAVAISAREGQAVETEVDAPGEVSGAVEQGEALGSVVVRVDGRKAGTAKLVAAESVEAAALTDKAVATVQNPIFLLPVGGAVIVAGLLLMLRGRHRDPVIEPAVEPAPRQAIPSPERPQPEKREPRQRRRRREREARERTPEERRKMHEERMRRRRERGGGEAP
jgi:D-alanyl-D-alanine carboxypeptidase (penicillin-binding protein 5/6)